MTECGRCGGPVSISWQMGHTPSECIGHLKDQIFVLKTERHELRIEADAVKKYAEQVEQLQEELLQVSKLAADRPMFSNPLVAAQAKRIRDRVLADAGYKGKDQ